MYLVKIKSGYFSSSGAEVNIDGFRPRPKIVYDKQRAWTTPSNKLARTVAFQHDGQVEEA